MNFIYAGASAVCKSCPLKDKCIPTQTPYKQIYRWEFEEIIEKHKQKMKTQEAKDIVNKRGSIVEHPFGTIKRSLGWDHFLVRGKEKVSGENALIMFTYNFKRMLNLIGITLFKKLIIAIKEEDLTQIKKDIEEYILLFRVYLAYFSQIIFMIQFYQQKRKILEK
ncbi:MAG: transposase [Campylobacterota bacterium]|nr:transposase [Campylobacterota bacterium]